MADIDCSLVPHDLIEFRVHFRLGNWIQGGGGLVQDDVGGVLVQRPRQSHLLLFPSGDLHAVILISGAQRRLQPPLHLGKLLFNAYFLQARPHLVGIVVLFGRDIFTQREVKGKVILEDHGEQPDILIVIVL